jgi:peptidoglycan hydrolase CwlO-like protein
MIKKILSIFLLLGLLIFFKSSSIIVQAAECDDKQWQEKVTCLENKVQELKSQTKTLSSQISIMDSQINLTQVRIETNKKQILDLTLDIDTTTRKISTLSDSLEKITGVLLNRIVATYQAGKIQPLEMLLSARDASNLLTRLNYLRIAQAHDKRLIYDVQQAKNDYVNQKDIYEAKKKNVLALKTQLEQYTNQLEQEKAGKEELLRVTKNDEELYKRLLAQAQAERAIVLGGGKEIFLRNVNTGDSIATIISGTSGCSTGTHLHFSVYQGTSVRDPNDYLSSKSFSYSYDSSLYGYYGTINPRGIYPWPIDDPIAINQGYGPHGYASRYFGGIHDGIDMEGGSLSVKAVRSGKLYQGSYGGCNYGPLNFVKIEHDEGLITWYLHTVAN